MEMTDSSCVGQSQIVLKRPLAPLKLIDEVRFEFTAQEKETTDDLAARKEREDSTAVNSALKKSKRKLIFPRKNTACSG